MLDSLAVNRPVGQHRHNVLRLAYGACARDRLRASLQLEVRVQFSVIGLNVLYAVIGVVLMYVAYRVFDILMPEVDVPAELQKGNVAVAIFVASIFISIALIIGKALG